jgi:hypothetical protein
MDVVEARGRTAPRRALLQCLAEAAFGIYPVVLEVELHQGCAFRQCLAEEFRTHGTDGASPEVELRQGCAPRQCLAEAFRASGPILMSLRLS